MLEIVFWVFPNCFFYFENLVQVLPSTMSFCVSDNFFLNDAKEINHQTKRAVKTTNISKVLLRPWAWWANKFVTHTKGHCGWKNLYQILKVKKAIKEDSEDIFNHKESIKRMLIAWEWGTNEYICLTLLRSCGVLSGGNLKIRGKMNFILLPQESYRDTELLVTLLQKKWFQMWCLKVASNEYI